MDIFKYINPVTQEEEEIKVETPPINRAYIFRGPPDKPEILKEWYAFFEMIERHQNNPWVHPLTCGVDSQHDNLVARMTYQGRRLLLCPSCGYIQEHIPIG